jgi:hypothetical protein
MDVRETGCEGVHLDKTGLEQVQQLVYVVTVLKIWVTLIIKRNPGSKTLVSDTPKLIPKNFSLW